MTAQKMKITPRSYAVHHAGESPVFSESVTVVSLEDDGGGEFIVLKQIHDAIAPGEIRINFGEIKLISDAIDLLRKGVGQ